MCQWVAARQWVAVPVNMWQHLKVCGSMSVGGSICQCVAAPESVWHCVMSGSTCQCMAAQENVYKYPSLCYPVSVCGSACWSGLGGWDGTPCLT